MSPLFCLFIFSVQLKRRAVSSFKARAPLTLGSRSPRFLLRSRPSSSPRIRFNLDFETRWRVGSCMWDQPGPSLGDPLHSPVSPGVPWGADPNLQDFNIILYEPGEAPPPRNLPKRNSFICLFSTSLGDSTSLIFPQQS